MKIIDVLRERIEKRFQGPKYAVDISVPDKDWMKELCEFLDEVIRDFEVSLRNIEAYISYLYKQDYNLGEIGKRIAELEQKTQELPKPEKNQPTGCEHSSIKWEDVE
jgi:hypothetical protein